MRAELALVVMMGLVGSSMAPEAGMAQQASAPQKPTTGTPGAKTAETVKPLAACGFCLEDGTKVPLTLGRELSSGKEVTGNRVDFIVAEDISVKGVVVIPKGSKAMGTIVEAQGKRRMGRAGKLHVSIEEVRLADGQRAKLRATQEVKGKGRQGLMAGAMIGTAIVFFPAAPVFLLMKGKDVVIPQGTPVASYVDGDTMLEEAKFESAPNPNESAEAAKTATPVEAPPSAPAEPVTPKTPPRM
jgi:hypothetical protein